LQAELRRKICVFAHICAGLEELEHAANLAVHGREHQGSLKKTRKEKKKEIFKGPVESYASEILNGISHLFVPIHRVWLRSVIQEQ
jgi:hypothetical protein